MAAPTTPAPILPRSVAPAPDAPRKTRRGRVIALLLVPLLGAGAGYGAVAMGFMGGGPGARTGAEEPEVHAEDVAFVALPPIVVNLTGPGAGGRMLRFAAQVETTPDHLHALEAVVPRLVDVLNGYLRALAPSDLDGPQALIGLRAQMLRRVQVVAGPGLARDLLVMEFVIN